MKVTQEKLPASQIGLEIEITPEMSKQAYEQVIQKFTRSANIPGFRKGKVPRQVLIQRFGVLQLKATALEDLIDDSLKKALDQEQIDALGNFQLRTPFEDLVTRYEPGSALTFSASVDVQPEVTLAQYTGLSVQAEEVKPDPEQVDQVLQQYQEQAATLVPVEGRPAQLKDVTVVDYKGLLVSTDPDGAPEPFPGGEAEDFQVELDEGKFIAGFIDGIVGMSTGETKDVPLTFPEDYSQENLAGREVIFTITLKDIKERELPPLDDDFAQEISEFDSLAELRESLEKRYQDEADERTQANKEQAILDELLKHIEVELPETLIERELSYMINQTAVQLQNQGLDIRQLFTEETIPLLKERSRPEAVSRIKRTLALGEVAKKENVKVDEAELNNKVEEILENLRDREIDRDRLKEVVAEDLLKEKIVDWLIQQSTVEMVPEGTLVKPASEPDDLEDELESVSAPAASGVEDAIDVTSEVVEEVPSPETSSVAEESLSEPEAAIETQELKTKKKPTKKTASEVSSEAKTPTEESESVAKRKSTRVKKSADGEES